MKVRLSEMLPVVPLLAIFAFNLKGVSGTCQPPSDSDLDDFDDVTRITTAQTEYVIDDIVTFGCDSGNGFGYFKIVCESSEGGSSVWGGRNRDCEDGIPFDYGALAGILCGVFTMLVCIVLIILSTRLKQKREKEEAMELKMTQETDATKA